MLSKKEVRGVLRVIVLLAGVLALVFHCGLFGFSYMQIAYGVDGATTERIATFLRPGRIALFFAAPVTIAALISAAKDHKRFHWLAAGALVAFIGVIVSLNVFW